MFTLEQYFTRQGVRLDRQHADECTADIRANAALTVDRVNALMNVFYQARPQAVRRGINSGWRTVAVNASIPKAARRSKHLRGQAVDIADADKELQRWLATPAGIAMMEQVGLWMEHPRDTPTWTHLQIVPPGSGRRIFYAK